MWMYIGKQIDVVILLSTDDKLKSHLRGQHPCRQYSYLYQVFFNLMFFCQYFVCATGILPLYYQVTNSLLKDRGDEIKKKFER